MSSYIDSLFSLAGKTALCTGATRGIGQSIALSLARAGADIVLVQRSLENLETSKKIEEVGRKVHVVVADLGERQSVLDAIKKTISPEADGGLGLVIDILVNCGGIQRRSPAEDFGDQDWDDVLQVNLDSVWLFARGIGKHMLTTRETSPERPRGKIINIASLLSFQGGITVPAYAAAKHGVLGLTKALSNEWVGKGINVNSVAPGYIATDMNTALIDNPVRSKQIMDRIPAGRWGQPEDFAGVVVFLASRASDYISGECVVVDGGWMAR